MGNRLENNRDYRVFNILIFVFVVVFFIFYFLFFYFIERLKLYL